MSEIDSEELVSALETLVQYFKEDLEPYSIDLCDQLVKAY